jgi:hypothetical protein
MDRLKALVWPGYIVAALLIILPLTDTLLSVWPIRLGDVSWRFGATGLFSRALMTPLLGLLLILAVALMSGHRRVTRGVAIVGGLAVITIIGTSVMFLLDAIQMRTQVRPEAKTAFDVASIVALAKYGLAMLTALAFAIPAWKASRKPDGKLAPSAGSTLVSSRQPKQVRPSAAVTE